MSTAATRRGCRLVTTSLTARVLLANQLAHLSEIRWTVICGDAWDDPPPSVEVVTVRIRRELSPSALRSFVRLWRHFRDVEYDFVQTHTPMASLLGLPAARLAGQPAIYTMHGALYFRGNGRLANIAGWCFERWCCAWASLVLTQSREDAEVLPRARICRRERVRFIGNGIDLGRFAEAVAPAVSSDRPVVVMASRLVREKGCGDFLELADALRGLADFVHVGWFEHDQRDAITLAEVQAARDSGAVTIVGPVEDVRPWLAAATVVVLPSYREGVPRVAMEAAAMGRPVLGYDIRGMREVVEPASALLVPRGDRIALKERLESLLRDPDHARRLGAGLRQAAISRFSEEEVFDRLRAVYAEVGRPVPARRARRRDGLRSADRQGRAIGTPPPPS